MHTNTYIIYKVYFCLFGALSVSVPPGFAETRGHTNLSQVDVKGEMVQNRSVVYHSVKEIYTDVTIGDGDTLWILGYYTNPNYNILLEFYGDWDRDEILGPQSYLVLTGLLPPTEAWNGGYIIVKGTISYTPVAVPLHTIDTILATIDVVAITVLMNGEGDVILRNNFRGEDSHDRGQRDDCDSCQFAILISGGVDSLNNHSKYWENLVALYNYKVAFGNYCESNVFVHYFKGDRRDNRIPQSRVGIADSAGIRNSHDEIATRVAECNRKGKKATFQKMVTNHGSADGTIDLLGDKVLKPSDLRDWQQAIIDSCCSVVKDEFIQCYGGFAVDEMSNLKTRDKATIYANSNADKETGHSPHGSVHHYLRAKIDSLIAGKPYEEAVVAGKMAYDAYLQRMIDTAHVRAQYFRNNPGLPNAGQKLAQWVADSTSRAGKICKSRNVTIVPQKDYLAWNRYVTPPGGQLVIDFEGDKLKSGNVSVYRENTATGQRTKEVVWNWNIPGSFGFSPGNERRVINGNLVGLTPFWITNDNDEFTMKVSATGNQDLSASPSNHLAQPGFSLGGMDDTSGEFAMLTASTVTLTGFNNLPRPLWQLPAFMGPGHTGILRVLFTINPSNILWTNMELRLDLHLVIPGPFVVQSPNSSVGTHSISIGSSGTYFFPMGDMTMAGSSGDLRMIIPASFSTGFYIDSWGLRSKYSPHRVLQNVIVDSGEEIYMQVPGYIITGGNGTSYSVMPGADVTLIAGMGISLMEGTNIHSGSLFNARVILPPHDPFFCDDPQNMLSAEPNLIGAPEEPEGINKSESILRIYPNPTTGNFIMELTESEHTGCLIEIYSLIGERILRKQYPALSTTSLSLSGQKPGIYIIRVMMGDRVVVEKIVKQ